VTPIDQVLDEGNCGRAIDRGEEACECAVKLTLDRRRQPHSRQSCEPPSAVEKLRTETRSKAGASRRVSQTSRSLPEKHNTVFTCIGKLRGASRTGDPCAVKATRLILGDPSHVSVRSACRTDRAFIGNDAGVQRKSAVVIVLFRRNPASIGRTEP